MNSEFQFSDFNKVINEYDAMLSKANRDCVLWKAYCLELQEELKKAGEVIAHLQREVASQEEEQ